MLRYKYSEAAVDRAVRSYNGSQKKGPITVVFFIISEATIIE